MAKQNRNYNQAGKGKVKPNWNKNKDAKYSNGSHVGGESATLDDARRKESYNVGKEKGANNVNFYIASTQLLKDVANMSWNQATGTRVNLDNPLFSTLSNQGTFAVPGIYTVTVASSFGWATNGEDPINVGAHYLYTFVRHANSGSRNYDPNDIMIAMCATAEVFSALEWAKRIYRAIGSYEFYNRYYPDGIVECNTVNPTDVRKNLPNLRSRINLCINALKQFAIPSTLPLFARRVQLYSAVYKEGDSAKDQLYMYVPAGYYKFGYDTDGAGQLTFDPLYTHVTSGSQLSVDDMMNYIEGLVRQVTQIHDISVLMGDIIKAYGTNLITMPELEENEKLTVVADLDVLQQIKNATVLGGGFTSPGYNYPALSQNATKKYLTFMPQVVYSGGDATYKGAIGRAMVNAYTENRLMTVINVDPTPADLMECTRMCVMASHYQNITNENGDGASVDLITGSEVVVGSFSLTFEYDAQGSISNGVQQLAYNMAYDTTAADADEIVKDFRVFARTSNFKFHPAMHMYGVRQSTSNPAAINVAEAYFFYDVDNFMVISWADLKSLHTTALLAEFGL